ncbi:PREDICTED: xanthine dehydrogenase/oxidase-like [Papilio xuthus]|uniref:Xanthine dehydrogenase/oxidase-like n=1 Tax=Papilio xuthus TaxID=66420 RepID=A0AAJ6Z4M7_PAPXU|nr:PREDICTED: xanthine dehydrogenase/oxidase-like [Papilio xuthus]
MDRIEFTVNKKKYSVGHEVDSDVTINDYLRDQLNLRGTKYMCQQGTCGSCIVNVTNNDIYGHRRTFSVNSCLVSITQCDGWDITTIEGIGDRQNYHPVQKTLAKYNGTQCGYCSPAWVMSMYSLLEENNYKLTRYQIEDSFGSNTCRCTGYRPILDAFKSFACDAHEANLTDIEDLKTCSDKDKCELDNNWCLLHKENINKNKRIPLKDDRIWYRVKEIRDVFEIFSTEGTNSYMLVNGNTGRVSASSIDEVTPETFLKIDMTGRIITQIKLPPLSHNCEFVSFKIMPRSQNAHAQVHSAFLYELDVDHETVKSARIVYGGLSGKFIHAVKTETCLIGKKIFTNETLQLALEVLNGELIVEEIRGYLSPEYRKKCALGLLYKGLLSLIPETKLAPRYRSGKRDLRKTRPLSSGKQEYDTNPTLWPLNEPRPKLEALIQCSGESVYVNDTPTLPREVFCAFVPSEISVGEIECIDPSIALGLSGVLAFLSAKDIPGSNNFVPLNIESGLVPEEILCERDVKYYNQPIGIIIAETEKIANRAALIVKAKYKNVKQQPVLTIREVLDREPERVTVFIVYPARDKGLNVQRIMKGSNNIFAQYHYHMETQSCVTKPSEDGIDVIASTQWPDQIHVAISQVLNIEQSRINLTVPRLGGAYGAKISRNCLIASACALSTYFTNRPCRFVMSMQANTRIVGKRNPCMVDYEVGVNDTGEVQYLEYHLYSDNGYVVGDPVLLFAISAVKNCYDNRRWSYKLFNVTTDTASNTYARSPGELEGIAMTEHIMERISYELDKDPLEVRLNNLNPQYSDLAEIVAMIVETSEYHKRKEEVQAFNKLNRWKKRGLRVALMSWPASTVMDFHVLLAVYHGDGSVIVRHGGIEIGQGINTKVAQTVAYVLQIPLHKVKIKSTEVSATPNSNITGGSRTTHAVCFGVTKCCQLLLDRLSTVRETMNNPTWELLIQTAFLRGINLQTSYRVTPNDEEIFRVPGAAVVEVELDILTGEHDILRADILQDAGFSINPELDIGQIEGAFIMATGYWTCEDLIYDKKTGELLTDRAWNYHVPLAKDIPIDFRVKLRPNSFNPIGVFGAKTTTEPPMCLAVSVAFALRAAIVSSREETGYPRTEWFHLDGPFTLETNVLKADVNLKEFLFY